MTNETSAAPFESISELRKQHEALLEALDQRLEQDSTPAGEAAAMAALAPQIRAFQARGAATGMYLEYVPDRTAAQALLDYWSAGLSRLGEAGTAIRLDRFDGERLPLLRDEDCPYVGLEAFRSGTHFFGRETDTRALLEQVRASPLTIVLGASGSGKSSLLMGGLLPALAAQDGPRAWRIAPVCVPGDAALDRLARAAEAIALPGADQDAVRLRDDPDWLAKRLAAPGAAPALIVIDQFEEVFTLCADEDRQALAANLAGLLRAPGGHRVVLAMREEFKSGIAELRALEGLRDRAWFSMRPMGYEELHAAVARPAAMANLQFQPGIVDDLVKKVLGQAAALPLLQFTLRRLWEGRDRNRVTWEVYRRVKDPLQALEASADAFYDGLLPQTQDEVKRVLLELVRVDRLLEAYRQPLRKSRLIEAGRANTEEVLGLLADNDYLRITPGAAGEDTVVEIRHEALIRNWPMFVGWIDEKRVQQRQRLALSQAAERWAQSGRPPEGLLSGWQLQEAQRQGDLAGLEKEFVEASAEALARVQREREEALRLELERTRALAEKERKLGRRTRIGLVVAVVIALFYAVLTGKLAQENEELAAKSDELRTGFQQLGERLQKLDAENEQLGRDKADLQQQYAQLRSEYDRLFALQVGKAVAPASHLPSSQPITIFLQISDERQRARAREIRRQLVAGGIRVPEGIEKVPQAPENTEVRYFRPADRLGAEEIVRLVRRYLGLEQVEYKLVPGYEASVPGRQYEIWFGRSAFIGGPAGSTASGVKKEAAALPSLRGGQAAQ